MLNSRGFYCALSFWNKPSLSSWLCVPSTDNSPFTKRISPNALVHFLKLHTPSMHKLFSLCRTEVDMAKYGTLDMKDLLWSEAFRSCTQPRKLAETPVLIDWSSHCTVLHGFTFKVMQFPNFGAHAQEPWCWLSTWYVPGDDLKWHPGHLSCSVEPERAVRPL